LVRRAASPFFKTEHPLNPLWRRDNPRWRRLVAPGISAFVCFWLLIGLGVWQLYRLKWKEAILAQIHVAEISPPIPLPAHPNRFEKVIVTGQWVPGKAVLYGDDVHDGPVTPVEGGELVQPLQEESGRVILVDLGWVPERSPKVVPEPTGVVSVVGYVHRTEAAGWFAGADDPSAGLYYTFNAARIGADMGFANVAPFALVAMGPMPPIGSALPQPAQHLPQPPNNHYQYALTWFGFAIVLVFEFFFFARKRLEEP
jgi:surfeit locus 1 family protein